MSLDPAGVDRTGSVGASPPTDPVLDRYARHWADFQAGVRLRPALDGGRGRHRRALVVAIVNDPILFRRLDRIRAAIAGFAYMRPVPDHFLHVPLLDLGPLATSRPRLGELTPADLARAGERVRTVAAGLPPTALDLYSVNASESEVFVEVHPPDGAEALHAALADGRAEVGYMPRLPLAHVVAAADGRAVAQSLTWFRDRPVGRIRVAAVSLVLVDALRLHGARKRVLDAALSPGPT